jgi:hypothetical protein
MIKDVCDITFSHRSLADAAVKHMENFAAPSEDEFLLKI